MNDLRPHSSRDLSPVVESIDTILLIARHVQTLKFKRRGIAHISPMEAMLLRHIDRCPGITPGQLGDDLRLRASNTSVAVRELIEQGLIERRADEHDRRSAHLYVTEAAQRSIDLVHEEWEAMFGKLAAEEDIEATLRTLRKLCTIHFPNEGEEEIY